MMLILKAKKWSYLHFRILVMIHSSLADGWSLDAFKQTGTAHE